MNYFRQIFRRIRNTVAFHRAVLATPPADRLFLLDWFRVPLCWIRGHRWWFSGGALCTWRAYPCRHCGEELRGWTQASDMPFAPVDADSDYCNHED